MQYTDLTRKELQREYDRVARKYTNLLREPLALDMTVQDPLLGQSSSQRAVRHFGTVLGKELSDTGAAHRTVELCRQAGVCFDAVDHSTVLARIIPVDAQSDQLTRAAGVFAISARMAALESLRGTLMRA